MPKNIVICCDGTSGQFVPHNTNVVRLFGLLAKETAVRSVFYDPGLGTMSLPGALIRESAWARMKAEAAAYHPANIPRTAGS